MTGFLVPPFEVGEPRRVNEIDLGFERRLEAVIPVIQRRQDRHVVGLEHIKTWRKHVRQLPLVHKYSRLTFAHRQLGTHI